MIICVWIDILCRRRFPFASGKEYETFRCADLYPLVFGMQYMEKRGCSYQQFKDEADLVRCVNTYTL